MMDLPKGQKKTAQLLIREGLQRECDKHLKAVKRLLQNAESKGESPHDIYLKLYKKMDSFDRHIARRYDGMSSSRYFITILQLYREDILTPEDISQFSEEVQQEIEGLKALWDK